MTPQFGYNKSVRKLYDAGRKRYVSEYLPYSVERDAWMGTLTQDNLVVTGGQVTAGRQLKLLFLRVWSEYAGTTVFRIRQTGGDVGSAPDGVVDYIMLENKGAEVLGPVDIRRPIHVLEGSWVVEIVEPDSASAGAAKFGVVWWATEEEIPE